MCLSVAYTVAGNERRNLAARDRESRAGLCPEFAVSPVTFRYGAGAGSVRNGHESLGNNRG